MRVRWMVAAAVLACAMARGGEEGGDMKDGVRDFTFGRYRVTALADRDGDAAVDDQLKLFVNADADTLRALVPGGTFRSSINVFVIRDGARVMLVDAGLGAKAGRALGLLADAGVKPEDVTDVLMTHLHGDHAGGLHTDGAPTFPNAAVWVSKAEVDYWTSDAERDALPEARRGGFAGARAALAAVEGRLRVFVTVTENTPMPDDAPPLPDDSALRDYAHLEDVEGAGEMEGVVAWSLAGHTPGHAGYVFIEPDSDDVLFFWGDTIHRVEAQAARPDLSLNYDIDPAKAARTRREVLSLLRPMAEDMEAAVRVFGAHLPFPGVGAFEPLAGDGEAASYRYVPLATGDVVME